jgi:D-proline reductase (dithiol) PrdB
MGEPIAYMDRTRRYYAALGYPPYEWAHCDEVPFARPRRPLATARLALVTTASRYDPALGDQGPGATYNAAAKFYRVYRVPRRPIPDLRISHVGYDRVHTSAADPNTYLPIPALEDAVARGIVGSLADDVIGLPTNRSQRVTMTQDAHDVLDACIALGADVALLVPNCPVCHQSTALVARHLEAHGIATVLMGCARDIVEWVGVPRFAFSDFPLGNSAGKPFDVESQAATLAQALELFDGADVPRTTAASPQRWSDDDAWKADFMNIDAMPAAEIAQRRDEFARQKRIAAEIRANGR